MIRLGTAALAALVLAAPALAQAARPADPREGLRAGWFNAGEAILGLEKLASVPRPARFTNPSNPGDFGVANSDLGFVGDHAVVGNYNGFMVYSLADPARPRLVAEVVCPGGQGDVSVYGSLLFMSVEEARGRVDCGTQGAPQPVDADRFRGVRIFDLSDVTAPRLVGGVQTCRGSHTHTVVPDPADPRAVFVLVSGSSYVRPGEELAGCSRLGPDEDPNTSLFRIEVIRVPLDAPHAARVVSEPRVFADASGRPDGLWAGGSHGEGTQRTSVTNHCHDITAFPGLGLAGGACSGNGLLLDIRDPTRPVRVHEVEDPNFAYWHSATFNNDGTTVLFTDEWGGGSAPRCRAEDPPTWGGNAFYRIERDGDGPPRMVYAGSYKLPAVQTATENCVAHNGSLVPVPGRDVMVQAWYQGGISMFDFTDPAAPFEIAYFDRGPLSATELMLGGYWSVYWHSGLVVGTEIARGLDVFRLAPTAALSANEIEAAALAVAPTRGGAANPQTQTQFVWPAHPAVARAYVDQLERAAALPAPRLAALRSAITRADRTAADGLAAEAQAADAAGRARDAQRLRALADTLRALAG